MDHKMIRQPKGLSSLCIVAKQVAKTYFPGFNRGFYGSFPVDFVVFSRFSGSSLIRLLKTLSILVFDALEVSGDI